MHVLVLKSPTGGTLRLRLARPWSGEGDGQSDPIERFELSIVADNA